MSAPLTGDKAYRLGTHRSVHPDVTLTRALGFARQCGITRVANITGLDRIGMPVFTACRPNSRSIATSQGKGITAAAAKASAVMEAIESFHAEDTALEATWGSQDSLKGRYPLADVARLPKPRFGTFREQMPLLWTPARDLIGADTRWVPMELIHTDFRLPLPPGSGSFFASSNGLASGNTASEAISHGICEVVERDANTLWSLSSETHRRRTKIDPNTVADGPCRDLVALFQQADVSVVVWDVTSDIGIPAFMCKVGEDSARSIRQVPVVTGSGCHPVAAIALMRALTEAAQGRLTIIAGARDDLGLRRYDGEVIAEQYRVLEQQLQWPAGRSFSDVTSHEAETFEQDITWQLDMLRAAGIDQVLVVDLGRPDIGIPVVRVVIPGLEFIREAPGYAPGPRARRVLAAEA